jgi:hypothetical protein
MSELPGVPHLHPKGRGLGPFAAGAFARVVVLVGRRPGVLNTPPWLWWYSAAVVSRKPLDVGSWSASSAPTSRSGRWTSPAVIRARPGRPMRSTCCWSTTRGKNCVRSAPTRVRRWVRSGSIRVRQPWRTATKPPASTGSSSAGVRACRSASRRLHRKDRSGLRVRVCQPPHRPRRPHCPGAHQGIADGLAGMALLNRHLDRRPMCLGWCCPGVAGRLGRRPGPSGRRLRVSCRLPRGGPHHGPGRSGG